MFSSTYVLSPKRLFRAFFMPIPEWSLHYTWLTVKSDLELTCFDIEEALLRFHTYEARSNPLASTSQAPCNSSPGGNGTQKQKRAICPLFYKVYYLCAVLIVCYCTGFLFSSFVGLRFRISSPLFIFCPSSLSLICLACL